MIEWFIITLIQGVDFIDKNKSALAIALLIIISVVVVVAFTNAASVICNLGGVQNSICPSWLLDN